MPEIAANTTHARLENWLVAEGEAVTTGKVIAEIETEKAMVELTAESDGVLHRQLVSAGTDVGVGTPIAVLGSADATADEIAELLSSGVDKPDAPASTGLPAGSPAPRQFSSPLARTRARELGLEVGSIDGSGPSGRVTVRDVLRQAEAPTRTTTIGSPAAGDGFVDLPHSPMRRAIARRLTESKATVPHFYVSARCRVDALLDLRRQVNAKTDRRVSVTDLIVCAVAAAFFEVPDANVIWTPEALRRFTAVDVSLAVATDGGLLTPVLRDVGRRSVVELSDEIADVVARARAGRLHQHELEGGSFAVTNLGMYGTAAFAAILNPPQSGILAVGAAREEAIVVDGAVRAGTVIDVTLSVDHRAIDGALAATWLAAFCRIIENPVSMLIRAG